MDEAQRDSVIELYKIIQNVDREDEGVNDDLSRAQASLNTLKMQISELSRQNFKLERDVRVLDSRIALLIQQKGASLSSQRHGSDSGLIDGDASGLNQISQALDNADPSKSRILSNITSDSRNLFGQLFFILQSEPSHLARMCTKLQTLAEIDPLLETIMFTIYGNQFDTREEHLMLVVFQLVLADHFDRTTQFSSLLRANTPVSRLMMTYMRRGVGQAYLQRLLGPYLKRIATLNDDIDINPTHVFSDLSKKRSGYGWEIPYDGKSEHPCSHVIKVEIERRLKVLKSCTDELMAAIFESVDTIPYGFRWTAKQIKLLAQHKFPEANTKQICSLLGAYFFLRYVNPAIVSPQAYLLVKEAPEGRIRRNLTMVAKIIQLLANQATVQKETWAVYITDWIHSYQAPIQKFLYDLCAVPDFSDSLELDHYMALKSPQESLDVPLRELVDIQHLLLKYPSSDDRIKSIISNLGKELPRPSAKEGSVLVKLPIHAKSHQNDRSSLRMSLTSAFSDSNLSSHDLKANVHFLQTKAILVMLLRIFPQFDPNSEMNRGTQHTFLRESWPNVKPGPLNLHSLVNRAIYSEVQVVAEKGIRAQFLLQEYQNASDLQLLQTEVELETSRLGSLKDQVAKDLSSLEAVYVTVRDRNEYLEQQLDVFRSYINNLRGTGKAVQTFTPQRFIDRGLVVGQWPWGPSVSLGLRMALRPQSNGSYTLTLDQQGRESPVLELWFTLDDLLELDKKNSNVDLQCLQLRPSALAALIS